MYELVVEQRDELLRIIALNSSSLDDERHLLNIRVKRADVLHRWPDPSSVPKPVQPTSIGAQNQCRRWLVTMMRES